MVGGTAALTADVESQLLSYATSTVPAEASPRELVTSNVPSGRRPSECAADDRSARPQRVGSVQRRAHRSVARRIEGGHDVGVLEVGDVPVSPLRGLVLVDQLSSDTFVEVGVPDHGTS